MNPLKLQYGLLDEEDRAQAPYVSSDLGWNLTAQGVRSFIEEYPNALFVIGVHNEEDV